MLAAHRAATPELLHALSRVPSSRSGQGRDLPLALLARLQAPASVVDTALSMLAEHEQISRPLERVATGAPRRDVVRELANQLPDHVAFPLLRGGPDPDWDQLRTRALSGEVGQATLFTLAMDTAAPLDVRLDAAGALVAAGSDPRSDQVLRLAQLAAIHPSSFAGLREVAASSVARALFTAGTHPHPAWIPVRTLARRVRRAELSRDVDAELIRARSRAGAVAMQVVRHCDTSSALLSMLAHHPLVPLTAQVAATARLLTGHMRRRGTCANHPSRNYFNDGSAIPALLRTAGITAPMVALLEQHSSTRWEHALQIVTSPQVDAVPVAELLRELGNPVSAMPDRATVAARLAAHPAATRLQRRQAVARLRAIGDPVNAKEARNLHQYAKAGALLPDLAAAGSLLPLSALTDDFGDGSFGPLINAALGVLLPQLTTAETATACVTLAPLFTGTLGELVATACAVGA